MTYFLKFLIIPFLIFFSASIYANGCIVKYLEKDFISDHNLSDVVFSLSILVDQTTIADDNLKNKFNREILYFLKNNDDVSYALNGYTFSSFLAGQYMQHGLKEVLHERKLTEKQRKDVVKKNLQAFDACQKTKSYSVMEKKVSSFLSSAYLGDSKLVKSDIMESFIKVANEVSKSKALNKIVVIYSDMLENSSITSFYANNAVRKIDHAKELALAEKAGMFADFAGAKVYVMGAGLVSEQGKAKGVYRDPKMMQELKAFWAEWFKRSNAELVEFGTPEMLGSIN